MICEEHPDQPLDHDPKCGGPWIPCPECNWHDAPQLHPKWQPKASTTTARDYSVMPVLVVQQEPSALARAVRSRTRSTRVGDYVDVEFGATFATIQGRQERVGGQWRQCRIVKVFHSELHVVYDPSPAKAPPDVPFG